jgi:hypothetical protein
VRARVQRAVHQDVSVQIAYNCLRCVCRVELPGTPFWVGGWVQGVQAERLRPCPCSSSLHMLFQPALSIPQVVKCKSKQGRRIDQFCLAVLEGPDQEAAAAKGVVVGVGEVAVAAATATAAAFAQLPPTMQDMIKKKGTVVNGNKKTKWLKYRTLPFLMLLEVETVGRCGACAFTLYAAVPNARLCVVAAAGTAG